MHAQNQGVPNGKTVGTEVTHIIVLMIFWAFKPISVYFMDRECVDRSKVRKGSSVFVPAVSGPRQLDWNQCCFLPTSGPKIA